MEVDIENVPTTTIFHIPEEVLLLKICSYLTINELLGLRRVNKWAKYLSDEYLRINIPSKCKIYLDNRNDTGPGSLEEFLVKDVTSEIRIPSKRMHLLSPTETRTLQSINVDGILHRYGNQITHLEITRMSLPVNAHDGEFQFFEKLPKLKSLTIERLIEGDENDDGRLFPENFKNLTTLSVASLDWNFPTRYQTLLRKLIEYCTNLEHIQYPHQFEAGESNDSSFFLEMMMNIVEKKTNKRLKFLDITHNQSTTNQGILQHMRDMILIHNMKCLGASAGHLSYMEVPELDQIAPNILSLRRGSEDGNCRGIVFPNVNKISFSWFRQQHEEPLPMELIRGTFPSNQFPNLKILKLSITQADSYDGEIVSSLWLDLHNLEELDLNGSDIGDSVFLGSDAANPSFLRLTKLRKLRMSNVHVMKKLTNITFQLVFRHLGLRKFRLRSLRPIESFTKNGIRSLLIGRFNETIEKFPFNTACLTPPYKGWAVAGLNDTEFLELGREFRCNKAF